ncbi:MAG: magnesium transporter CorA family protein [Ktedonobacteraceae bacterium]
MPELSKHSQNEQTQEERMVADEGSSIVQPQETPGIEGDVLEIEMEAAESTLSKEDAGITCFLFQTHKEPHKVDLVDLPELVSDDENFIWVDVSSAVIQNVQQVADLLHLHQRAVQITLASWKRPGLDMFKTHFFVTTTLPRLDFASYHIEAQKLAFFVGRNFLVSTHQKALPFTPRVLQRARQSPNLIKYDSTLMLFILLDELLGYYEILKEQIQTQIEIMEERALTDTSQEFLSDLLHFKRYAFALSQLAGQHRPIFTAFLRPDFTHISGREVEVYYRDLDARHSRLEDMFLGARDAINVIFDIYISHVSHFTNNVMKTLTIVSTVLLPATIIIGIFGTNSIQDFPLLIHFWGFILMIVSIITSSVTILLIFHHKGWLWQ